MIADSIRSEIIPTFSIVFNFTSLLLNNARPSSQRKKKQLDGKYLRLNGLGFGDGFSRNSDGHCSNLAGNAYIMDLTSGTAGLKYREIPTNRSLVAFNEGDDPDL